MHRWRITLALVSLALALQPGVALAATGIDRWYVVELTGQRAGHAHETQRVTEEGDISTSMKLVINLKRLGSPISITMETSFVETEDGTPLSMGIEQDMGVMRVSERYLFDDDEVKHTTIQAGRTTSRRVPRPAGEWLTPNQAHRLMERKLDEGAELIAITALDPSAGLKPITSTYRVQGEENVEVMGKIVPAVKWTVEQSLMPGVITTEYVDLRGETLRSDVSFGGITMTLLASEREMALAEVSAPELMAQTLIRATGEIENPRELRRAEYVLTLPDGGEISEVVDAGAQRATRERGAVRVRIDLDDPAPAPGDEVADRRYRASSTNADIDDPEIRRLVDFALRGTSDRDTHLRAETLRQFVHEYIEEKSLGVGFATASEVCRTRQGDCSEHGVLLAAMLRADGIPSRVVSGLIYVDQFGGNQEIFGYHMWTQALLEINGELRWIDLDATLPKSTPYDAAHIALSTSSLDNADVLNSMAALVGLLGSLKIEVVRAE